MQLYGYALALVMMGATVWIGAVGGLPAKPLNERAAELGGWQAWLLVDESHDSPQHFGTGPGAGTLGGDGVLRRRITPKSIFVAPTFSPDKLEPCADGYESDSMGRCVKIIKIDEDAHLEFLLQKLNAQFGGGITLDVGGGDGGGGGDDQHMPTPGPVKFDISLGAEKTETETTTTNDTDRKPPPTSQATQVIEVVQAAAPEEISLPATSAAGAAPTSPPLIPSSPDDIITTTTTTTTTDVGIAEDDSSIGSIGAATTITEPHALFFRTPNTANTTLPTSHAQTQAHNSPQLTYDDIIIIGNRIRLPNTDADDATEVPTTMAEDAGTAMNSSERESFVTMSNQHMVEFVSNGEITSASKPVRNTIRFPVSESGSSSSSLSPPPQEPSTRPQPPIYEPFDDFHQSNGDGGGAVERVRDSFEQLFNAYISTRVADLTANERRIFTSPSPVLGDNSSSSSTSTSTVRPYNHRNRDKHHVTWQFPLRVQQQRDGTDALRMRSSYVPRSADRESWPPSTAVSANGWTMAPSSSSSSSSSASHQKPFSVYDGHGELHTQHHKGSRGGIADSNNSETVMYKEMPRKNFAHFFGGFRRAVTLTRR